MLESASFLEGILDGPHGSDCQLQPDDSPAGATIRVIFDLDYQSVELPTGVYQNTDPRVMARTGDVTGVQAEVTRLRLWPAASAGEEREESAARDYIAQRLEPVVGTNSWRAIVLREV